LSKTATIVVATRSDVHKIFGTNFGARTIEEGHEPLPGWAGPRPIMEENWSFIQPIPYVVVRARIRGEDRFLAYKRGQEANEGRLVNKMSIGIGGHVDAKHAVYGAHDEMDLMASVRLAADREMAEEIGAVGDIKIKGLIHSDKTPVGRVHLGVVYLWDATDYLAGGGDFTYEKGIDKPAFMTRDQLRAEDVDLEEWSRFVFDLI